MSTATSKVASSGQAQPSQQQPSISSAAAKTPVNLAPNSHLDPSAYVRGTNPIEIGKDVLIHPRAHLVSIHGALTIQEGSIVSEKSIIGGPIPPSSSTTDNTQQQQPPPPPPPSTSPIQPSSNPTTIGPGVHIHPNVQVHSGAQIRSHAILEANVTVAHNITIGQHSKICAGVSVSRNVPDWTVVYGINGEHRRRRQQQQQQHQSGTIDSAAPPTNDRDGAQLTELARLKAMRAERDTTMMMLKKAAARTIASRTKR